ncbi:hypothetical protein WICMUC_005139 [Wickerhamomyces mucosus]|uniref:arginyltransferase n=1 Tax=Wickerhamomyces mucosus TaxID=1378264 RepID=A0A9P8T7F7_9ASCO|nr:hypothetical protein WICMUC_005139 [Wickerhamomyces mucosus]
MNQFYFFVLIDDNNNIRINLKKSNVKIRMTTINLSEKLILTRPMYISDKDCGYCHGSKTIKESISLGFHVENFTPLQYDKLIQLGFRRSGTFLYKTNVLRNCCKMYTIRTNSKLFKINKEFKKCINNFNKSIGNEGNTNKQFDLNKEIQKIFTNEFFEIRNETPEFTDLKYQLYDKYQKKIHKDKTTSAKSFKRFLCDSPFPEYGEIKDHKVIKYGAIHQCYYLKNQLIAIAVLDVLPSGLSSVYFIYDPDYNNLELGKLSAILELIYCNEFLKLDHYYMGFIIESCQKMVYKQKFGCEVLNPLDNYKWYSWESYKEIANDELLFTKDQLLKFEDKNREYLLDLKDIRGVDFIKEFDEIYNDDGDLFSPKDKDLDNNGNIYDIPVNFPGLKDLKQVYEKNFESIEILNYSNSMGRLRFFNFEDETPTIKKVLMNIYRIIGDELMNESILII